MNTLKILIVEDEPLIAEDLACTLMELGYEVVDTAHDYDEAMSALEQQKVDFLLLDIELDGDQSGIDLAKTINAKYHLPFIFLTSYSDKATIEKARQVQPMAYLVKPIDEKDLLTTIEIALYNYNQKVSAGTADTEKLNDALFIKHNGTFVKVEVGDIERVEAQDNYSLIYTKKKKYLLSNTLKLVEERLRPWSFLRVHRSHLINAQLITKIEEGYVFVADTPVPVSKKHRSELYARLNIF